MQIKRKSVSLKDAHTHTGDTKITAMPQERHASPFRFRHFNQLITAAFWQNLHPTRSDWHKSQETLVMVAPDADKGGQAPMKDRYSEKNLCKIKEHSSQIMIHATSSVFNSA